MWSVGVAGERVISTTTPRGSRSLPPLPTHSNRALAIRKRSPWGLVLELVAARFDLHDRSLTARETSAGLFAWVVALPLSACRPSWPASLDPCSAVAARMPAQIALLAGAAVLSAHRLGVHRIPGTLSSRHDNLQVIVTLGAMIVVSILLTIVLNQVFRRERGVGARRSLAGFRRQSVGGVHPCGEIWRLALVAIRHSLCGNNQRMPVENTAEARSRYLHEGTTASPAGSSLAERCEHDYDVHARAQLGRPGRMERARRAVSQAEQAFAVCMSRTAWQPGSDKARGDCLLQGSHSLWCAHCADCILVVDWRDTGMRPMTACCAVC